MKLIQPIWKSKAQKITGCVHCSKGALCRFCLGIVPRKVNQ